MRTIRNLHIKGYECLLNNSHTSAIFYVMFQCGYFFGDGVKVVAASKEKTYFTFKLNINI